jgi:CBS domain-containing protein
MVANILLSATLNTGWPQGSSSYVSGQESATARTRSAQSPVPTETILEERTQMTQHRSIRELMTTNPTTVEPSAPVADAARVMKQLDVGPVPVVENGDRLAGIVTDRDIVLRVVAAGGDPQSTTVGEIMSRDLATVDPDQPLEEALRLMARHQVRRLPVCEEDGRLVGIVAQADIATELGDDRVTGQVVEEISR